MQYVDNDRWQASFTLDAMGVYEFTIEAWRDLFASWATDVSKKLSAGQSVMVEIAEGEHLLALCDIHDPSVGKVRGKIQGLAPQHRLELLLSYNMRDMARRSGPRAGISRYSRILNVACQRQRARFSAWYEVFPRSITDDVHRHGTFDDVIKHLPYVRDLGFDVLYLTPIHPIGTTNRKGPNNTLSARADDPGSVYAIGSKDGGHDATHPQLGTLNDFRRLNAAVAQNGLELALDIAVQCSPDHPWVREHPEWFLWRPDGSIRYAENPPKKYEDIVNVHFDDDAYPGLWFALRDVIKFLAREGVRIFRIDNPHTKPLPFWRWLISEVNSDFPDAIFLSEAFTRPKMMKRLAKIGFQQSYTYFTWRNAKHELMDYITELTGPMSEYYRPNFFVNTPDINPLYLQTSGRSGFIVRATLAATLSSNWGLYSGFELCEASPLPGSEEYLNSEKYEIKVRDLSAFGNIKDHIRRLNAIRNEHAALQNFNNTRFLNAWNDNIIAYARMDPGHREIILVMANLDPHRRHECVYEAPLWEFHLPDHGAIDVEDLLSGGCFTLFGKTHQIALDPAHNPVVIWRLIAPTAGGKAP